MTTIFEFQLANATDHLADLLGEPINPDALRLSVAAGMYGAVICAGGNHRQAYAMLVDECGPDLADAAISASHPQWRETPRSQDGGLLYGETRTEQALRQAGLIETWMP